MKLLYNKKMDRYFNMKKTKKSGNYNSNNKMN